MLKNVRTGRKILEYICLGLNNKEIGERMYLSRHTVKKEVAQILAKYQARNRVELASKVLKCGIIKVEKLILNKLF